MFGQSPKSAFFLSQTLLNIFRKLPPSFKYNITFDEKKFSQRKNKMLPTILFLQLSKAAKPTDLNAAKGDYLFYSPHPRLELNRLKHLATAHRRQRISMDFIAEGEYFLFLQRLVDDEIYRLKSVSTLWLKNRGLRTVLNCFVKGNSSKESRLHLPFFSRNFLEN